MEQKGSCRCLESDIDVRTTGRNMEASLISSKNQLKALVTSNRGFTLLEVMILVVVLAAMVLTIYIGVMYAEKQTKLNYRHRVATFLASGEIEKQYTLYMKEGFMRPYTGRQVIIDDQSESIVRGSLSLNVTRDVEFHITKRYGYTALVAEVNWVDPETKKSNKVVLREDFYDVEGKVNP